MSQLTEWWKGHNSIEDLMGDPDAKAAIEAVGELLMRHKRELRDRVREELMQHPFGSEAWKVLDELL